MDETRVTLRGADGRARIYQRRGERNAPNCVTESDRLGGGSVMEWAGISLHTKAPIVNTNGNLNARQYQNQIVQPFILPHLAVNKGMALAQEIAPYHVTRTTRQMLIANRVRLLHWPAKCPDLNPMEHVWDLLKRRIRALPQQQNNRQLAQTVAQVWNGIPQRYLQRYIVSMRSRCRAVLLRMAVIQSILKG